LIVNSWASTEKKLQKNNDKTRKIKRMGLIL